MQNKLLFNDLTQSSYGFAKWTGLQSVWVELNRKKWEILLS